MKRDTFSGFHPAINLLYFVLVIGFAMTLQHPVCQAISLLSGFAWSCALTGGKGGKKLGWLAAMFALTALVNPLFSHAVDAGIASVRSLRGRDARLRAGVVFMSERSDGLG